MNKKIFLWLLCLFPLSGLSEETSYRVIDMHAHALPPTFAGEIGAVFPATGEAAPDTIEKIMTASFSAMTRNNVEAALVSGPLEIVDIWRTNSPVRLLASPKFPVFGPWPDIEELRERYARGELQALGEITGEYAGLGPNSPEFEPYYALAEELDIPVQIHLGQLPPEDTLRDCCENYSLAAGNPLLLDGVLKRHPNLRLYICHMGRPFVEETLAIMRVYPRVYADFSGGNTPDGLREYILTFIRHGFGDRLMYGSDQMIWPGIIDATIRQVVTADYLTNQQKQDLLYNNAARFLRFDEDTVVP